MALLLGKMKDTYDYIFYELADERTRDMFPSGIFIIILLPFYLYFSTKLGPRIMRDLQPFQLKTVMFYYNLFQVFICLYMLPMAIQGGWFTGYSFSCQPVDYTNNPKTRIMIRVVWWYTVVKLIDLFDTVFFVLRKKDRQISLLHLFHHFIMPIAGFICLKYYSNGHGTFVGVINTFVHIIMYTYYLIAGLGTKYQKYLWWKKHVTALQLIQFCIIFVHNFVALLDNTCDYPKWINLALSVQSINFIYMFGSFYYQNYIITPKKTNENTDSIAKSSIEKNKIQ